MFFKKQQDKRLERKLILGMIMIKDELSFDLDNFIQDYHTNYSDNIKELSGDNSSVAFKIEDEMIAVAHVPLPIPPDDIEGTAGYAYNWPTALDSIRDHKSHLIVSILKGGPDPIKRYRIFTQIICALLRSSNSIGVYKGSQSLLISKDDYLNEAELMSSDYLPLNLWIYIGLRYTDKGNCGYTYGLNELNKTEMEVLYSTRNLEDIRGFIFNIASYVLDYDITFKDGQTCGLSADEKIAITFSKGQFVTGNTFKLAY